MENKLSCWEEKNIETGLLFKPTSSNWDREAVEEVKVVLITVVKLNQVEFLIET